MRVEITKLPGIFADGTLKGIIGAAAPLAPGRVFNIGNGCMTSFDEVLAAGRVREAKEAELFGSLRSGSTTVELLGLDASLVRGT